MLHVLLINGFTEYSNDLNSGDWIEDQALQHTSDTEEWFRKTPPCYFDPNEPFDDSIPF